MSCDWRIPKTLCENCSRGHAVNYGWELNSEGKTIQTGTATEFTVLDKSYQSISGSPKEGVKHDQEKIRLELLPTEALEEVAKVLTFGAKKYGDWNWAQGMSWSRLMGAAMRHLFAFARRESNDPETNLSHMAHLACCAIFLLTYQLKELGTDDRPKLGADK